MGYCVSEDCIGISYTLYKYCHWISSYNEWSYKDKKIDFFEALPPLGQSGVIIGPMFIILRVSLFNMTHHS